MATSDVLPTMLEIWSGGWRVKKPQRASATRLPPNEFKRASKPKKPVKAKAKRSKR